MWVSNRQAKAWVEALGRGDSKAVLYELAIEGLRWASGVLDIPERVPGEAWKERCAFVAREASRTLRVLMPRGTSFVLLLMDLDDPERAALHVASPLSQREVVDTLRASLVVMQSGALEDRTVS